MKVADDPEGLLSTETIARRGAILYKSAMKGYEELKAEKPDAMRPYSLSEARFRSRAALRRLRILWQLPAGRIP